MATKRKAARKRKDVDTLLDELGALEDAGEASCSVLRQALEEKHPRVVAYAARRAGELGAHGVAGAMESAFVRLTELGPKGDPGSKAKLRLVETLSGLEHPAVDVYLRGVDFRERMPAPGGSVDTAAGVRATCGLALARLRHPGVCLLLARLLADEEREARAGAAIALGTTGMPEALPLLRFKILSGDDEGAVVEECLRSLLTLDLSHSEAFVRRLLDDPQSEKVELAALALAEAKAEESVGAVIAAHRRAVDPTLKGRLALALALFRTEDAFVHLLTQIEEGGDTEAEHALDALLTFSEDAPLMERVSGALEARDDAPSSWKAKVPQRL